MNNLNSKNIVLNIDGYASLVAFRTHLPQNFKITKNNEHDDAIEDMAKVITEAKYLPEYNSFDLGSFTKKHTIANTSPTL